MNYFRIFSENTTLCNIINALSRNLNYDDRTRWKVAIFAGKITDIRSSLAAADLARSLHYLCSAWPGKKVLIL